MVFATSFAGAAVAVRAPVAKKAGVRAQVRASGAETNGRRQALGLGLAGLVSLVGARAAQADQLTDALLAKSGLNKGLNDQKRMATSSANFARARTVTDGTCSFPNNLIGCENEAENNKVKFLSDDIELECSGSHLDLNTIGVKPRWHTETDCASKSTNTPPSFMGV